MYGSHRPFQASVIPQPLPSMLNTGKYWKCFQTCFFMAQTGRLVIQGSCSFAYRRNNTVLRSDTPEVCMTSSVGCVCAVQWGMHSTAGGWLGVGKEEICAFLCWLGGCCTCCLPLVTLLSQFARHLDTGCLTCGLWTCGFSGSPDRSLTETYFLNL